METTKLMDRIEIDPEVMLGKPVIRGTRITVEILLEKLAVGATVDQVLADYPDLQRDDLLAALDYARYAVGVDEVPGGGISNPKVCFALYRRSNQT